MTPRIANHLVAHEGVLSLHWSGHAWVATLSLRDVPAMIGSGGNIETAIRALDQALDAELTRLAIAHYDRIAQSVIGDLPEEEP